MHKKLGPLEAWQWAAILAALAGIYLLYEHNKNTAAAASTTAPTTGADTGTGPIDPTTGLPYASEIGGGGISGAGGVGSGGSLDGPTLQQELSDLGAIEGLFAGLPTGGAGPAGLSPDQEATLNGDLNTLNKTLGQQQKALSGLQKQIGKLKPKPSAAKRTTTHGGTKNPGHRVTTHPHGAKSASSSAPHNARQHHNIAAPTHQRAYAIKPPEPKKKPKPARHH